MPALHVPASGVYEIRNDYTATSPTDDAITFAPGVHNVTILNYARLICPASFPTNRTNRGIRMNNNNACQIIGMGGHIRGFGAGVWADNCTKLTIDNLTVEDALFRGIKIVGNDAAVKNCLIRNIYGSTWNPNQYCMGIEVSGERPLITHNTAQDFRGSGSIGEGVGICLTDLAADGIVKGNISQGSLLNGEPRPYTIAYWVGGNSHVGLVHNHAVNCNWGFAASSTTDGLFDENTHDNCNLPVQLGLNWTVGGDDG